MPHDDSIDEGPGEHDAHLMDDDPSDTVACAHCGEEIWSYAQRCPQCGTHFRGEAWQFEHRPRGHGGSGTFEASGSTGGMNLWSWIAIAVVVALIMMFLRLR